MAANADFNWPRRYSFSRSISVNVSFTERTLPADTLGIIGCELSAGENAGVGAAKRVLMRSILLFIGPTPSSGGP